MFALAIVLLFLVGFTKRHQRDSIDRCLLLLFVLAGLAFLTGTILASGHAAIVHHTQSRGGVDPSALSYDWFLIEWQRLLFSFVSVFALIAAGLLAIFKGPAPLQDSP